MIYWFLRVLSNTAYKIFWTGWSKTKKIVEGFNIDDFGDAHDENIGFCNVIRKGEITGKIEDGRFVASDIKLSE